MTSADNTIDVSSLDDQPRSLRLSFAPNRSMESFHIQGAAVTTAAHYAVDSSNDSNIEMDDSPSERSEASQKAKTERTIDQFETVDSRDISVENLSSSSDEVGQSGTTVSVPSRPEDGISSGSIRTESDDPKASLLFTTVQQPPSSSSSAPTDWRPIYLQSSTQIPAMCFFFLLAAIVETLLVISLRKNGLATCKEDIHYLWTYGPTALLTLVAALWGRVAFQAQLVAPWYRLMQPRTEAQNCILLDYFDMISPVAIFNSFRNHDWIVSIGLSVSLLIQLVIVLSTGLIDLRLTEITDTSYPMRVTRKFIDREDPVTVPSQEVLRMMDGFLTGFKGGYFTYPDGTSDLYAWEIFDIEATVGTETRVRVPGFSASLTCEPAITEMRYYLNEDVIDAVYPCGTPWITMNISSSSGDCTATYTREARTWYRGGSQDSVYFSTMFNSSCQGAGGLDANRLVSVFGFVEPTWGSDQRCYASYIPQDMSLRRSTSLVCNPGYSIQDLDIIQNGTSDPIVQPSKDSSSRTLENVHPWSIMSTIITSMISQDRLPTMLKRIQLLDAEIISDSWTFLVFLVGGATKQTTESMFHSATLEAVLRSYYERYAAQLAAVLLMKFSDEPGEGTAILLERRLLVSPWICHTITGLLIVAGLACLAIGTSPQRKVFLPFNPSIPYGTVTAFSQAGGASYGQQLPLWGSLRPDKSPEVLSIFSYLAMPTLSHGIRDASLLKAISEAQVYSHHGFHDLINGRPKTLTPLALQPYSRAFACLAILGIMVTLGVTLKVSNTNRGLGEAGSALYTHFLWTSLPAVVFSGLSLSLGSMASAVLCLSPYWNMKRSAHYDASIGVNLLGELPPVSLFRAARLGLVAAATAAAASMLTPWFNIFTPSLFEANYLPTELGASLLTTSSFGSSSIPWTEVESMIETEVADFPTTLALQILRGNMSYPAFTWENLAFPEFSLSGPNTSDEYDLSSATIETRVPAIRSSLSCDPYNSSQISSSVTLDYNQQVGVSTFRSGGYVLDTFNVSNPLAVNLTGEICASKKPNHDFQSVIFDTTIGGVTPSYSPFMAGFSGDNQGEYGLLSGNNIVRVGLSCNPFVFIWGHFNLSRDQGQPQISASAVACRPTAELVDVNLTFRGPELAIDSLHVDDASARQTSFGQYLDNYYRDNYFAPISLFAYGNLPGIFYNSQPQLFDAFASLLTISPYALTPEDIGNPDKAQQVEDAIKFQYGILQTQYLHTRERCPADRANATLPNYAATSPGDITDALAYPAVVTVPNGNHRVVQDPVSTFILEGLLAVVLALTLVSWAFSLRPGVLPRSPTSIANILSLAAGGNLLEFIVRDTEGGPPDEDSFDKYIFWLGRRSLCGPTGVEQERFGIWVLTEKEFEVVMEERRRPRLAERKVI